MKAKANQKLGKRSISKSTDLHKIYLNYNNGNDYIMIKDNEAATRSRIV